MIGIFDSGYGGLTILQQIRSVLPQYDYMYLGDNARAPYGTRSFECIYRYTLEAVRFLLANECTLIILACNTASAKALRTIQQHDLPLINQTTGERKVNVLGVIRPTVEAVPTITRNGHIGILATPATISSESYVLELEKAFSNQPLSNGRQASLTQQACPMWVPLIETGEHQNEGADYFVDKYLREILALDPLIDTLVLGCTHYPLLLPKINQWLLTHSTKPITALSQGKLVADSLADYLRRHTEYEQNLTRGGGCKFLTTDDAARFEQAATLFLGETIQAARVAY